MIDERRDPPTVALRFRAFGWRQYSHLGVTAGPWEGYDGKTGWTCERAKTKLAVVLDERDRGVWRPPIKSPPSVPSVPADPTFADFVRMNASNVRNRVLAPAVKRASERLVAVGEVPLPEGITPHKLRHTFASLLVALGEDVGSVMDQLGHADAGFTLRVYRHAMRRDEQSKRSLRELVGLSAPSYD